MSKSSHPVQKKSKPIARSDHACFGCGDQNPIGLHLHFEPTADGVEALFVPGPEHQGFEDVIHGGIISTVLDEAMAWAIADSGLWAVTGEIRVRFRLPLRIEERASVTARVTGFRRNVVMTSAELARVDGLVLIATASATFVRVSADVEAAWRARYLHDERIASGTAPIPPLSGDRAEPEELRIDSACDDVTAQSEDSGA